MLQAILGHSIALYVWRAQERTLTPLFQVVFDMFYRGFYRKFTNRFPTVHKRIVDKGFRVFWVLVTYFMAILIPKLEIM